MTNRSRIIALLTLALAAPLALAQAPAPPPPSTADVPADQQPSSDQLTRLFEVMRVKEQMASMTKSMPQIMQKRFSEEIEQMQKDHPELASLTPEQQQAAAAVMTRFSERAMTLYTSDEMLDDLKAVYKRHLTQADVEATATFYASPAGQHLLDMGPAIVQEFLPAMMQKMQDKTGPLLKEMSKEMLQVTQPAAPAGKPDQH